MARLSTLHQESVILHYTLLLRTATSKFAAFCWNRVQIASGTLIPRDLRRFITPRTWATLLWLRSFLASTPIPGRETSGRIRLYMLHRGWGMPILLRSYCTPRREL